MIFVIEVFINFLSGTDVSSFVLAWFVLSVLIAMCF